MGATRGLRAGQHHDLAPTFDILALQFDQLVGEAGQGEVACGQVPLEGAWDMASM